MYQAINPQTLDFRTMLGSLHPYIKQNYGVTHTSLPESVNVSPAMGMNSQS